MDGKKASLSSRRRFIQSFLRDFIHHVTVSLKNRPQRPVQKQQYNIPCLPVAFHSFAQIRYCPCERLLKFGNRVSFKFDFKVSAPAFGKFSIGVGFVVIPQLLDTMKTDGLLETPERALPAYCAVQLTFDPALW